MRLYAQPTIYTGCANRPLRERRNFRTVCHVAPFDTEEEAVSMANDTKYGLARRSGHELKRGHRVAQQMKWELPG